MSFGRDEVTVKTSEEGFKAIVDTLERSAEYIERENEFQVKEIFTLMREDADLSEFDEDGYEQMMETVNKYWDGTKESLQKMDTIDGYRMGIFVTVNEINFRDQGSGVFMSISDYLLQVREEMIEERAAVLEGVN
jgi:hypothetical protein